MQKVKAFTSGSIMIIISLVFLSQAITIEKATITDPAGGSFFPALLTTVMLITGIVVIIQDLKKLKVEEASSKENANVVENSEVFENNEEISLLENIKMTSQDYKMILTYFLIVLLYVISMNIIPFLVATLLFLIISIYYLRGISWKTNIIVSISSIILIHLIFTKVFQIIFP